MFIPIKYNLRYLATRWSSTLLTAGTFALVVATFVIVMSLARGIERALTTSASPLNALVLRPGAQAEGQSSLSIERFNVIRNWPGIARDAQGNPLAAPEAFWLINKPRRDSGEGANLQIRGVDQQSFKIRPEVRIVEGRTFTPGRRDQHDRTEREDCDLLPPDVPAQVSRKLIENHTPPRRPLP